MRIFSLNNSQVSEYRDLDALLAAGLPESGRFVWIASARREFEVAQAQVQAALQQLTGHQLVDLHISDLLNNQLPSHYDYTSQYDMLVFRRLAAGQADTAPEHPGELRHPTSSRGGPPILRRIDTSPVGFAVFDRVLLTIHPTPTAPCAMPMPPSCCKARAWSRGQWVRACPPARPT